MFARSQLKVKVTEIIAKIVNKVCMIFYSPVVNNLFSKFTISFGCKNFCTMVKIEALKQGKKIDYQGRGEGVTAPIFKKKYLTRNQHNFYVKKLTESDLPILKDYLYQTCSYDDIKQGVKYETQRWLGVFNSQRQLSSLLGVYFTKNEIEIVALESFNNFKNGLATYLMDILYNWAVSYKIKTISVYKDVQEMNFLNRFAWENCLIVMN